MVSEVSERACSQSLKQSGLAVWTWYPCTSYERDTPELLMSEIHTPGLLMSEVPLGEGVR